MDVNGDIAVAGGFSGILDLGGGPLACAGGADVFVAKLDPAGIPLWAKRFGDKDDQNAYGGAIDALGRVVVGGGFSGTADFGGGVMASSGAGDAFVAMLDAAGGHLWSKRFGDASEQAAYGVRMDATGNVLLVGEISGIVDFGGGPLASAGGEDAFAVKLDASGAHLWSKRLGGVSDDQAKAVAVDAMGNVVVTGYVREDVDFGAGLLTGTSGRDVFVAKLSP
ncbi:Hypothetical protein A7982_07878 [Minicystis rosea]|nr:Hypothetical protein A7982_07878 [Minicystis rosea]